MQAERGGQNLARQVYAQLEQDIVSGKLRPGDSLAENKVSRELGVSRTPVREALCQLEAAGLVENSPGHGVRVVGVSEKDTREIYQIRVLIEGMAAAWAAERIGPEALLALEENMALQEFSLQRHNAEKLGELDHEFHHIIYAASDSRPLYQLLTNFHHHILQARSHSFKSPRRAQEAVEEHRAICAALAGRSGDEANRLMARHIQNAARFFMGPDG